MATDTRTLPANLAGDTEFRAWGGGISAQLAAVGLVKASDTGQIDWTTVARPSTTNTYAGYEIWRFNDSLQATKPVFIKLEYGVAGAVTTPTLRVVVCTATNGAGTPSGQIAATRTTLASAKGAGVTLPSYCSGGSSRLNLCNNFDVASSSFLLGILVERSKTAAGADTGDAIMLLTNISPFYQFVPFTGAVPSSANNPALDVNSGGSSVVGTDVLLAPTIGFYGKSLFASWCIYKTSDPGITALTPIAVEHFGASHTYMPFGTGSSYSALNLASASGYSLALLWE